MLKRLIPIILLLALAWPVAAGNWAVVTVETLPTEFSAGEPLEISFSVRRHGVELFGGLSPTVVATHPQTGRQISVAARPLAAEGFYAATMLLDAEGIWQWQIDAFNASHAMPPLTVGPQLSPTAQPSQLPTIAAIAAISVGLVTLLLWPQQRRPLRLALALLLLFVIGAGLLLYQNRTTTAAVAAAAAAPSGEQLFIAKGCATCHAHGGLTQKYATYDVDAPNLTHTTRSPEWLATWLANPSTSPGASGLIMPNLNLSSIEIEQLVHFLSQ